MEPYSNKNNRVNPPPPYSILNPEISSLSPSLKSNGARFLSATITRNHIRAHNQVSSILLLEGRIDVPHLLKKITLENTMIERTTS
jgi:hypothetical protein